MNEIQANRKENFITRDHTYVYLGGSLLRLDRFGEKGVFDWKTGNYPVPLWYESVALEGDRKSVV